jgi:hypothetical protein
LVAHVVVEQFIMGLLFTYPFICRILSQNRISVVETSAFAGLSRLSNVNLDNNPITVLQPNTFAGFERLGVLTLRSCQLRRIPRNTFLGLSKLSVL